MSSPVVVIERDLLKSPAFRQLNGTAKTVFFDFLMKRKIKMHARRRGKRKEPIILNNGELEYTYAEAERKGIPRASFMRAIDTLVEYGFIDITHSGSGGKKGDKSLYAISERWRLWGTSDFHKMTRPKDKRKGRGFAIYWQRHRYQK